ncbi:MAG: hypothetical protein AAF518_23485 [Spirochaetota bacterium]
MSGMKAIHEPLPGIVVVKFRKIKPVPLLYLRNQDCPDDFCEDSMMYFFDQLGDELENNDIDLEEYKRVWAELSGKYFMSVGYTTNMDLDSILSSEKDYDYMFYYPNPVDVVLELRRFRHYTGENVVVVDEKKLQKEKKLFAYRQKIEQSRFPKPDRNL